MNTLTDFHFLRPLWLLGLPLLALLLWLIHRQKRQQGEWGNICDAWLLPHVLITRPGRAIRFGLSLLSLGGLLALLALAGPAWEREPTQAFRNEQALVIALNLSQTMDAADIKPSRLERARYKIADLLQARKDGQTALVAYAGEAFTVTPLTDDAETIRAQLGALSSAIMPEPGSRSEQAMAQSAKLLQQAGLREGHVLLISDSAALNDALPAAEKLRSQGYTLSVLGVGTAQGAPIAQTGGGFVKDDDGTILVPKLDGPALQALAVAGGGRYLPVTGDSSDVQTLARLFDQRLAQNPGGASATRIVQWQDQGPWFLLPLLPLAAMAFRRGLLAAAFLTLLLPWSNDAAAFDWQDLWQTPDQQAQQAMQQNDFGAAAGRFQDPAWKSAAYYRAKQYDKAAEALTGLEDVEALYNRGNALAQAGKYPEAIAAYEQALKKNPEHADARHNKEVVEKQLQQQKDQEEQQQPPNDGKQPKEQDKPKSDKDKGKQDKKSDGKDSQQKPEQESAKEKSDQDQNPSSAPKPDKQDRQKQREQKSQVNKDEKKNPTEQPAANGEQQAPDETEQANEAWLKRIPDDPGGLLKRKFQQQHQQRRRAAAKRRD